MNTAYNYYYDNCILIPHQFEGLKSMFMIGSTTVFTIKKCKLELSNAFWVYLFETFYIYTIDYPIFIN